MLGEVVSDLIGEYGSVATYKEHGGVDKSDDFWTSESGFEVTGDDIQVVTQSMISETELEEYGFNPDGDIMFWTEAVVEEGDLIEHNGNEWLVQGVQEIQLMGKTLVRGLNCNGIRT